MDQWCVVGGGVVLSKMLSSRGVCVWESIANYFNKAVSIKNGPNSFNRTMNASIWPILVPSLRKRCCCGGTDHR
jgi:hypothetical protein